MSQRTPTTKLPGGGGHPVAALDLPGLVPAPLDGLAEPICDRIAPGDLLVDESYQRGLSARSLRLIRSGCALHSPQWPWFSAPNGMDGAETTMRRWIWTSGWTAVAIVTLSLSAHARDIVRVDWTFANTEIAPLQQKYATRVNTFFILDGRRITDSNNTTALPGQVRRGTSQYDVGYSVRYGISGDGISKIIHTVGTNLRVDVTFLDAGGCQATVDYYKSPRKVYFETRRANNHERMIESDQHAEDVSCTVAVQ